VLAVKRIPWVLVVLVSLLVLGATPVLAQDGSTHESYRFVHKQNGVSADAFWETCAPDTPEPGMETCTFISLFGFDGKSVVREAGAPPVRDHGTACYGKEVLDPMGMSPPVSSEFGCTTTFDFSVAGDLTSASLSAVIRVEALACHEEPEGWFCEPTGTVRDVAVSAQWTAIGPVQGYRERYFTRTETEGVVCVSRQIGRGVRVEATATATVDGATIGDSSFAMITNGKFKFVDKCG
jgi:hypothetical protein